MGADYGDPHTKPARRHPEGGATLDKFEMLYDKVIEIIEWAEYQGHISEDGASVLIANIEDEKNDIAKL